MQDAIEYGDVVDDNDIVLRVATRAEIRARRLLHRGVCILCRDPTGALYVHRRTTTKDIFPGMYDMFVAGMLNAGESYPEGARRELEEELGIVEEPRFLFKHHYRGADNPSFKAVFEVDCDGIVHPQPEEIEWGVFMPASEVSQRLSEWDFVPDGVEIFRRYLETTGDA
jgi:isopentenyldiphosphate isomerase